ncbi:hypothetical protein AJ80_03650 [Polytolypa hystricis UAMH7299]|uniref:Uncharacterized protein n=1 Tax=Polytolypa hystricis (strain UAMH7299) TaxID=1447883 RepID=A0A2B7YHP0_POLH7|nr:hypothetical protein AJ80_03650 [Polytolypa hystricis UAMH7299]
MPLGSALSRKRREEAEHGPQHQTARRLAALFELLIPPTPQLISAYGTRVSDIIKTPSVNPAISKSHGPFQEYRGADRTAAWAAATSGTAALGVYLLSCLLVRAWDATEAISIWVELVSERKREIKDSFQANQPISEVSVFSALQEIPRQDLALWDSSARVWLRSADQAKQRQHDQLLLILRNITIPFPAGSSTYERVITTWKLAMLGIEDLFCSRPQSISHAGVLLALSSWHLYPDLIVLGEKTVNVRFLDPLIPNTSVCTISLQSKDAQEDNGVQWSLTLSHLRYYGSAVNATSPVDHSRGINPREYDAAAEFFCAISDIIDEEVPWLTWIRPLILASRKLHSSTRESKKENIRLVKYGQRRAMTFLLNPNDAVLPYFGLCNSYVLSTLSEDLDGEGCIAYLRAMAKSRGYGSSDYVIFRQHWAVPHTTMIGELQYYEYVTTVAHRRTSRKTNSEGEEVSEEYHARWYYVKNLQSIEATIKRRIAQVSRKNEICFVIDMSSYPIAKHFTTEDLRWANPPTLFSSDHTGVVLLCQPATEGRSSTYSSSNVGGACQCFELSSLMSLSQSPMGVAVFDRLVGSQHFGLDSIGPSAVLQRLVQRPLSKVKLAAYLSRIGGNFHDPSRFLDINILAEIGVLPESCYRSLRALVSGALIYDGLNGASISLRIASEPLSQARWIPIEYHSPSRNQAFACIIHLDSGKINLNPNDLEKTLAMCTQNSIYVAALAALLVILSG